MLERLRSVGLVWQSIHGWLLLFGAIVTGGTFIAALVEQRPWSEIILLVAAALAVSIFFAYYGLRLYGVATTYFTSNKEKKRIAGMLSDLAESGGTEVDTATAAAIWAGTREEGDVVRHLRFRQIKTLIASGEITNTRQPGGTSGRGPNIHTRIPIGELKRYFAKAGIVESDTPPSN